MLDSVLNKSLSITALLFVQWPYTTHCIRHIQNSGIFRTQVYSGIQQANLIIFSIIKAYSGILRHYQGIFRLTQAYSAPCETQTNHIQNLAIVRTVYSGIIQPYSGTFKTLYSITLVYTETWHVWNPGIFRTLLELHPNAYSEC